MVNVDYSLSEAIFCMVILARRHHPKNQKSLSPLQTNEQTCKLIEIKISILMTYSQINFGVPTFVIPKDNNSFKYRFSSNKREKKKKKTRILQTNSRRNNQIFLGLSLIFNLIYPRGLRSTPDY